MPNANVVKFLLAIAATVAFSFSNSRVVQASHLLSPIRIQTSVVATSSELQMENGGLGQTILTEFPGSDRNELVELIRYSKDRKKSYKPAGINPGSATEVQKFKPLDVGPADRFGWSVAISGNTLVVGSYGADPAGAVYVYVRSGSGWILQQKISSFDNASGDFFGRSVAIEGNTLLIGASADDDDGLNSGSAYIFVRTGTVWTFQAKLTASDAGAGDAFGSAVAIEGDIALVGAFLNNDAGSDSGSAYVFTRSGVSWTETQKLTASGASGGDQFARSIAISGDIAIFGADGDNPGGSAYIFVRDNATWTQQQRLTASDAASGDGFGANVSISGTTAIVGAWGNDDGGSQSGSAYIFTRSGTIWTQQAKLVASDAAANDYFGFAVSVSGDTAIVGALNADDAGMDSGTAYVFNRTGSTWISQGKLAASDATEYQYFGYSVAISGDTALVGAWNDDFGAGAAYVFELAPPVVHSNIVASVLPNARAMNISNGPVTAFATILNTGAMLAEDCSLSLPNSVPAAISSFLYQTTDAGNVPTGSPNTPVNIPASGAQSFYFAIDANAAASNNLALVFDCANTDPVSVLWGVNTFAITASASPIADMVAIASTIGNTGYITIPATGSPAQSIAAAAVVNIGATQPLTVEVTEQADNGPDPDMAADLLICQTNNSGVCTSLYASTLNITANNGETYYFQILAIGTGGAVADDPAINRAHLYFRSGNSVVGATSVAVRRAVP